MAFDSDHYSRKSERSFATPSAMSDTSDDYLDNYFRRAEGQSDALPPTSNDDLLAYEYLDCKTRTAIAELGSIGTDEPELESPPGAEPAAPALPEQAIGDDLKEILADLDMGSGKIVPIDLTINVDVLGEASIVEAAAAGHLGAALSSLDELKLDEGDQEAIKNLDLGASDEPVPKASLERIAALKRMFANDKAKKADRRRKKTRARVKKLRAKRKPALPVPVVAPIPPLKAMVAALEKIVAHRAPTDRFLQNLEGREREIVRFWLVLQLARRTPDKLSDADLAAMYVTRTGRPMSRHQAKRARRIVEKLLAAGVWTR